MAACQPFPKRVRTLARRVPAGQLHPTPSVGPHVLIVVMLRARQEAVSTNLTEVVQSEGRGVYMDECGTVGQVAQGHVWGQDME